MFFALLALSFFPFVLKLAEIHDLAHRWCNGRRNFNEIKPALICNAKSFGYLKNPQIASLIINNPDRGGADELIDSIASLYRKKGLKTDK
jgi:hypothetical protein